MTILQSLTAPGGLVLLVLAWGVPADAQSIEGTASGGHHATISGYVQDAESGERLIGANIYDPARGVGATTNAFGFFSLTLPVGRTRLVVSYVGYERLERTLTLTANVEQTFRLQPEAIGIDGVEVVAERGGTVVDETQMSKIEVSAADVQTLPALAGEPDLLKTLQLLPGVQSGTEGSTGLYVRGGSPDQNLMLLDGATVYHASHLFGFLSTFNTDALNRVDIYKGGFPARYGGRLSSVLDVRMRDGNMQRFQGQGAVGLIASRLTVEGPLRKEKSSFIVSARRTYLDILTRPFQWLHPNIDGVAGYYFYDLHAKTNYVLSHKSRLDASLYLGNDRFYLKVPYEESDSKERFRFGWRNVTGTLRWNRILSPKMFANVQLLFSRFRYYVSDYYEHGGSRNGLSGAALSEMRYHSGIQDLSTRADVEYHPAPAHEVRFGGALTHHRFTPGVQFLREKDSSASQDTTMAPSPEKHAVEGFAFAEDEIILTDRVKANVGVHVSGFGVDGRLYTSVQPRLAARVLLPGPWALKVSYAAMRQYMHLLSNNGLGLPTDLWVPSTARIRPQSSWQAALGIARSLRGGAYDLSLEGYYKPMQGVIEYREGANLVGLSSNWEALISRGRGWSYGAELFLHKKTGRTTGWIGYTLARTTRRFADMNDGHVFPFRYDRRHDVSLVVTHRLKRRTVAATWVYGTGNAFTLPEAYYVEYGEVVQVHAERNGQRMRAYHRLDLSLHTPKRHGKAKWSFSIYNLYNRRNPLFLYVQDRSSFDPRTGFTHQRQQVRQISLFPVIPSFSYSFTF